jgi:hypothetical protein
MKNTFFPIILLIGISTNLFARNEINSLLKKLDQTIVDKSVYTKKKEDKIALLKQKRLDVKSLEELYLINKDIIEQYETFICDSAQNYIAENIKLAQQTGKTEYLTESRLHLAFVYSLSGLFVQAADILRQLNDEEFSTYLRIFYYFNSIRFHENLIKYIDNPAISMEYKKTEISYRDMVMELLDETSDDYLKEKAFKLQRNGNYEEAIDIFLQMYNRQKTDTHDYAMTAMGLARAYRLAGNTDLEEKYLILAAMTDTKLAVKENEALLSLAINLYQKGDINRSYNYIKVALDDANFYNSRFRNSVISRVQPIIEETYLHRIEQQKRNLRIYALLTSILIIALAVIFYFYYRQTRIVSKARQNLRIMNEKLSILNKKLDEANLIKEKYIGYFMNQCAVYINKLDEYRKNVNRKIKAGQIEDLYKLSSRALEKEIEELYSNFDRAFLKLYPDFVDEFNSLLKPEEHYKLDKDQLNNELRIFALIRLGITDVSQIATFFRYSIQTIYNYKSKVKGKSLIGSELFEKEVRKLGSLS